MSAEIKKIVESLKKMQGSYENAPKGLPGAAVNADNTSDAYVDEGLTDPGIQNQVTGSGGGSVIGGRSRVFKGAS